jgi:putative endonuclease
MASASMHNEKIYCVYILCNKPYGTLYIGFTGELYNRMAQHLAKEKPGFTARYDVNRLVHYETFADPGTGIQREKTLKKWPRAWKINLIERENPHWDDLFAQMNRNYQVRPVRIGLEDFGPTR